MYCRLTHANGEEECCWYYKTYHSHKGTYIPIKLKIKILHISCLHFVMDVSRVLAVSLE